MHYLGGKIPATFCVEQPRNSSGRAENVQSTITVKHNLLAPTTDRLSLRMTAPPRTVPSTAIGIPTPPEGQIGRDFSQCTDRPAPHPQK